MNAEDPKIFAVYKPVGPTSHDVMYSLKRRFRGEKVGHAGTLDPLAEGILVVGVGRSATKLLHTEKFSEKEYEVRIKLGETSTTDDAEGDKNITNIERQPSLEEIETMLPEFVGHIQQVPPIYSAIKTLGVPAYKTARKGGEVNLASREVWVKKVDLLAYGWPYLDLRVITGPGVYIRSLARDMGAKLGVGGYVSKLKRTRVGEFASDRAISVDEISSMDL